MDAVVVTFNSAAHIGVLADFTSAFERVVVVDNASTDGTLEVAARAGFEGIQMGANRGFAAAANAGATRTRGPVFCVLNPDVLVSERDDLLRLGRHFVDSEVGAVGPALRLPDGSLQDSARRVPSIGDLFTRRLTRTRPDAIWSTIPLDVEWVVGAFMMIRRSSFEAVGGFDERFFLYFEDVDFGVRLREAGYRVRYDPTCVVRHEHQAASRQRVTSQATQTHMRSAVRFYARHPSYLSRSGTSPGA